MSFFVFEAGTSLVNTGSERKVADQSASKRLRAKLIELRAYGVDIEIPAEESDDAETSRTIRSPRQLC